MLFGAVSTPSKIRCEPSVRAPFLSMQDALSARTGELSTSRHRRCVMTILDGVMVHSLDVLKQY